jgi:hypothetical protein
MNRIDVIPSISISLPTLLVVLVVIVLAFGVWKAFGR